MPHERRRHVRKVVDLNATLYLGVPLHPGLEGGEGQSSGESWEVRLKDLSIGGAYVITDVDLPFDTAVSLVLRLPNGEVAVKGTVRWCRDDGLGVQFGLLGAKATYAITTLLEALEPAPDSRRF